MPDHEQRPPDERQRAAARHLEKCRAAFAAAETSLINAEREYRDANRAYRAAMEARITHD